MLLTLPSAFPYCHPLRNASPKKEGVSPISDDFPSKIGCQPWQRPFTDMETNTRLNIYTNISTTPENVVKIGLVVSEISLLQVIVKKKERIGKKVMAV